MVENELRSRRKSGQQRAGDDGEERGVPRRVERQRQEHADEKHAALVDAVPAAR